jgi:hypothetical protein
VPPQPQRVTSFDNESSSSYATPYPPPTSVVWHRTAACHTAPKLFASMPLPPTLPACRPHSPVAPCQGAKLACPGALTTWSPKLGCTRCPPQPAPPPFSTSLRLRVRDCLAKRRGPDYTCVGRTLDTERGPCIDFSFFLGAFY